MFNTTLLSLVIVLFVVLLIISKKQYKDENSKLNEKEYPLKQILGVGMYLFDKLKYEYSTSLDREILILTNQIYGAKKARYFLKVFWANVITMQILSIAFVLFYLIATESGYSIGVTILILLAISLGVGFLLYRELDNKVKRRQLLIRLDFADLLSKLTLLINAGMTVSRAMDKIVEDNDCVRPLYAELQLAMAEIKRGKSEYEAYEDFGKRCRVLEIFKFVSIVLQNLRRGNSEMVAILRVQANECWLLRKSVAKQLGEEASSKLLFPMMMMFIAIIMIVMTPAILSMATM